MRGENSPRRGLRYLQPGLLMIAVVFLALSARSEENQGLRPQDLRCEYQTDPLGIDVVRPRLSWKLASDGRDKTQTAYRILVSDSEPALEHDLGTLWDSEKIQSRDTLHIVYEGASLTKGQVCLWKVKVWDESGRESEWSSTARWEMALLGGQDWGARWIGDGDPEPEQDEEFYLEDPAPLFRREFEVTGPVKKARLYISGLGYYEASINGLRVGDHVLDPAWTDYSDRIFYSTYDVTDILRSGKNCLGVMLGNGWYNPLPLRMWGRRNLREDLTVGRPRFIARLEIEGEGGTTLAVVTNSAWKTHDGPVLRNNVYLGEVYDARREIENWDRPELDDSDWDPAREVESPGGKLQARPLPPIRITAEIVPIRITRPEPGCYIFDMGQNFAGWARLEVKAERGTEIRLRYGELLHEDGTLNPLTSVCGQIKGNKQDGTPIGGPGAPEVADQRDIYIAKGKGIESYTPRFTFHGFRYIEISGLPGQPNSETLTGLRLNTDVETTGRFICSDPRINRIQDMVRRTFLSNMFGVQSDCPHREKFGYGGDLVATSDAFLLNFDMSRFYAKAALDWHDAALADGMLTDTAPFVGIQYCGVAWAMAHPHLLEQLYRYYGDKGILDEQFPTAARWLDLVAAQNPDHIIREGLSDHEALEQAPSPPMVTPMYHESARMMSDLAGRLGEDRAGEKYAGLARQIKAAYLDAFLEPGTGRFDPDTQASQAFALYLDLAPPEERQAALDRLLQKIRIERDGHFTTGIFGTKFILEVLSRAGLAETAFEVIGNPGFPGWLHMIDQGATTLWEHWEFSDNTYSHNHPMFGSVSEWFYRWLAGIQPHPEAFGFDRILIRPQFVKDLEWAEASYESVRGRISSSWSREEGRIRLKVEIPCNTRSVVELPVETADAVRENGRRLESARGVRLIGVEEGKLRLDVGSGAYVFDIEASRITGPQSGPADGR